MLIFNEIDKWFGRWFVARLVHWDLQNKEAKQLSGDALYRFIYRKHKRTFKAYDVTYEQIASLVEKEKKKEGLTTKVVLAKARSTIRKAVKEGRVVFEDYDKCLYTNRKGGKETLTFDQLATKFMDSVGQRDNMAVYFGINDGHIKTILIEEYRKAK